MFHTQHATLLHPEEGHDHRPQLPVQDPRLPFIPLNYSHRTHSSPGTGSPNGRPDAPAVSAVTEDLITCSTHGVRSNRTAVSLYPDAGAGEH